MNVLSALVLLAATISMGLTAGVLALYAHTIMPGLAKTDDRTFVGAFQAIDRAILNPWFLGGGFFGALVFTVIAAGIGAMAALTLGWAHSMVTTATPATRSGAGIPVPMAPGTARPLKAPRRFPARTR